MSARERSLDRGTRLAAEATTRLGRELRQARTGAGLSVDVVAAAAGISNAHVSRIERGMTANVSLRTLARLAAVVGLDLSVRMYPGAEPLRDAGQRAVLTAFASMLHPTLRWATEVPLPIPGDPRAWDGLVAGSGWRYGVEAETQPGDGQALVRRLQLKLRDGDVDGLILVLPNTRRVRTFVRLVHADFSTLCPRPASTVLSNLREGNDPGGGAVVVIPARHTSGV